MIKVILSRLWLSFAFAFVWVKDPKEREKSGLRNTGLSHVCTPSKSKLWDCTRLSTSKLRSSSSFLLSRSSSSLACFLNPGLTSSRASSCKVPGTWVNEGFSCCLEGVVEAQIFWAGATVLGVKSYWLMKFYGEFPNDCSPASQQPRPPAGHFCTFDQFCHQSWSSACNLWHQTLQTGFLEQSTTFEPASVVLTSPPLGLPSNSFRLDREIWNRDNIKLFRSRQERHHCWFPHFSSRCLKSEYQSVLKQNHICFSLAPPQTIQLCKPFSEYELWALATGESRVYWTGGAEAGDLGGRKLLEGLCVQFHTSRHLLAACLPSGYLWFGPAPSSMPGRKYKEARLRLCMTVWRTTLSMYYTIVMQHQNNLTQKSTLLNKEKCVFKTLCLPFGFVIVWKVLFSSLVGSNYCMTGNAFLGLGMLHPVGLLSPTSIALEGSSAKKLLSFKPHILGRNGMGQ